MVRNSLQKVVLLNFLLARNRFRTNYNATFLWDSSGYDGTGLCTWISVYVKEMLEPDFEKGKW